MAVCIKAGFSTTTPPPKKAGKYVTRDQSRFQGGKRPGNEVDS